MPLLRREYVQFAVLLLCVPVQYLVVRSFGSSEVTRNLFISEMINDFSAFRQMWLSVEPWKSWCQELLLMAARGGGSSSAPAKEEEEEEELDEEQSPAFEVLKFKHENVHFGQSPAVRDPKPPQVKFRVGQVVRHKIEGYSGVIVAWDESSVAPESWLKTKHGDKLNLRDQPNYRILIDSRSSFADLVDYVPQENIEVSKSKKVIHPSIEHYFEDFDGLQFIPRPWLKRLYPRD